MTDHKPFDGSSERGAENTKLARWLQQILYISPPQADHPSTGDDGQLELLFSSTYHMHFYQQLPDFIMALLTGDKRASVRYAPLLYHLAGCAECRSGYADLYDSMHAALYPQGVRSYLGQGTRTLAATPPRMLGHLCRTLISQAEAVLLDARRSHVDQDENGRSLLRLALRFSAHIVQNSVRRYALRDLVRVATLFDGPSAPGEHDPGVYSYSSTLSGAAGVRGKKAVRRVEAPLRPSSGQEQLPIILQSHGLEGSVVQRGQTLELRLQGLAEALRGQYVIITVPLGSLIEPVRWLGGNPRAIRSSLPVDAAGTLVMPLGDTDLQLSQSEDRNLLEAMFLLLEMRPVGPSHQSS